MKLQSFEFGGLRWKGFRFTETARDDKQQTKAVFGGQGLSRNCPFLMGLWRHMLQAMDGPHAGRVLGFKAYG